MKPEMPAGLSPEALAQLAAALPELMDDATEAVAPGAPAADPMRAPAAMPDPSATLAATVAELAPGAIEAAGAPTAKPGRLMPGALPLALLQDLAGIAAPVDVMKSLGRLQPQMAAMEREIDRLITTPVKLI